MLLCTHLRRNIVVSSLDIAHTKVKNMASNHNLCRSSLPATTFDA